MVYELLFSFFDTAATLPFLGCFTLTYLLLHAGAFSLLARGSPSFRAVTYDKQTFILINLMEGWLLAFIRSGKYFNFARFRYSLNTSGKIG